MSAEKSGYLFLTVIVGYIGALLTMSVMMFRGTVVSIPLFASIIGSEMIVLLPAAAFAYLSREKWKNLFPFRRVRISTLLLTLLLMALMSPVTTALNAFTMMFVENEALEMTEEITAMGYGYLPVAFIFAFFGPLCEELVFRGIIYSGLRRTGRILPALLLQALMFGCMHMNFNQMAYAIVLGFVFGILAEITGSLLPGFLAHASVNFTSVTALFSGSLDSADAASAIKMEELVMVFAVFGIISVFSCILAACLIQRIAKNEPGGEEKLYNVFHGRRASYMDSEGRLLPMPKEPVVTVPALIALALSFAYMLYIALL